MINKVLFKGSAVFNPTLNIPKREKDLITTILTSAPPSLVASFEPDRVELSMKVKNASGKTKKQSDTFFRPEALEFYLKSAHRAKMFALQHKAL